MPTIDVAFENNVGIHNIKATSVQFNLLDGNGTCERTMLPIVPAYALTVHKLQGTTLNYAVIDLGDKYFAPAQKFVALSRCRSLDTLLICDLHPARLIGPDVCNVEALAVIKRLRLRLGQITDF
jgi:ATP-dependent exoDNAse (exonuclease V) alpha subunit